MTTYSLKTLALLSGVAVLTLGVADASARDTDSSRQYNGKAEISAGVNHSTTSAGGQTSSSTTTTTERRNARTDAPSDTGYHKNHRMRSSDRTTATEGSVERTQNGNQKWSNSGYKGDVSDDVKIQSSSGTYSKNP